MAEAIQQEDDKQKTFLATVSHELRTPISYVKGYSEAIKQQLLDKQQADEAIQLIISESTRMERLTTELLQLARQEQISINTMEPIVLAETIRDAVLLLKQQAVDKKVSIFEQLDEEIIVLAQEEKMKQVLINIIENAIRYSKKQGTITVKSETKDNQAIICIVDEGIGIPAEDLPHITERFYRVNKARSRSDGGSGLGLSIVEQIMKQHQGELFIVSTFEKGTSVTLTLPLLEEL
jgi:signal transduction histidine kinase